MFSGAVIYGWKNNKAYFLYWMIVDDITFSAYFECWTSSQIRCFRVLPYFFVCDLPLFASLSQGKHDYTGKIECLNGLNTVLQQNSLKFTIFMIYEKILFEWKKYFPKSFIAVTHVCYTYGPCEQSYQHGFDPGSREMPALFTFDFILRLIFHEFTQNSCFSTDKDAFYGLLAA